MWTEIPYKSNGSLDPLTQVIVKDSIRILIDFRNCGRHIPYEYLMMIREIKEDIAVFTYLLLPIAEVNGVRQAVELANLDEYFHVLDANKGDDEVLDLDLAVINSERADNVHFLGAMKERIVISDRFFIHNGKKTEIGALVSYLRELFIEKY